MCGCAMLKPYNVRLDVKDIKAIDDLAGNRSTHIRKAISMYLQPNTKSYNVDTIDILQQQIIDLRADKQYFKDQANALLIIKAPLLQRIILKLRSPP